MENIREIELEGVNGMETHIIIDKGNNEYESMPKWVWEERQAESELGGTL